jgi:ligand-binding sensor domain-containing protein/tRNA A-37 threonylcarbamoyl transferase component Bud32
MPMMKKRCTLAFIGIIGLLMVGECLALDPEKAVTQYIINSWNDDNGLPQNTVRTLLQTSDGYLWIGTEEGLARFDGLKFTRFDSTNTAEITNNFIFTLFEDSSQQLWIGTVGGGLLMVKNGQFKCFTEKEGFTHNVIHCIVEDHKKNLWIGTDGGGIYRFDGSGFTVFNTQHGVPHNIVRTAYIEHEGKLWIGTSKGLAYLGNNTFIQYAENETLSDSIINAICQDSNDNLWIGADTGFYLKEKGKTKFIQPKIGNSLETKKISAIFEDKHKNIWLGTAGNGLIRYSSGTFSLLTKADGLSDNEILCINEDREGGLWLGMAYGGINQLRDGKVTTITVKEGLTDNIIFPIYEDSKGYLWIGSNNGLNRYKDGQLIHFTKKNGMTNNIIDSLYEDHQGFIWVGTDDGLNRLRNTPARIIKVGEYCRKQYVLAISEDREGNIWAGTLQGIKKIEKNRTDCQELSEDNGLASNVINCIYRDRSGDLWISTYRAGLTVYRDGKFTLFTKTHGLSSNSIFSIYEDNRGVLWIGSNNGLTRLKDRKFKAYTKKDGLFHNNIYQILEDKQGNLWMSCNKGIFRVLKQDLNDFADGKIERIEYMVYGREDGMRTNECNGGFQWAGCKTADGRLWFPTTRGVVIIDPAHIPFNDVIPPVFIEHVLLDGISSTPGQGVNIRPGIKHVEFHYTAPAFLNPQKIKFKYKLEGYDEEWVDVGTQRTAWYTNLDGGTYSFRVIACNDDGIWNNKGAATAVTVIPPFWKTWWFTIIALLAFAFFSYIVIHFSRKYLNLSNFWKRQKYVGQFKLLDKIGAGGMGTVYKASNLVDKHQTVAIKVLREDLFDDESNVKRFKQEAAIIDQLDHPNIIRVIERGQSKDNIFIAMEFLQGKTLSQKIQKEKKLKLAEAVHVMVQVADAIAKIHGKNIIHRDLKPDNIMLIEKDGDANFVKLLDFGLAKTQYQTRLTQTGIVIGTINYLSPEQISGMGASAASDIYALGIMFYETITGEKPFIGDTTIDIMKQIIDKTPIEPIRFRFDMSFDLNHLIMKMLDKKIESRPTITEVLQQLRTIDANLLKIGGQS